MSNFRIIISTVPNVLLRRDRSDENNTERVIIESWHDDETCEPVEEGSWYHSTEVTFSNPQDALRFIDDYSHDSAKAFVESFRP